MIWSCYEYKTSASYYFTLAYSRSLAKRNIDEEFGEQRTRTSWGLFDMPSHETCLWKHLTSESDILN